MKKDFVPIKLSKIDSWEHTFSQNLDSYAATLGFSAAQVTAIKQQINAHRSAYAEAQLAKKTARSKVTAMQQLQTTTLRAMRKMARLIKANPNYSTSMGESLGIIGPEDSREITRPTLKARTIGGRAVISYRKYRSHGIYLYSKRGHETQLTLLAADMRSPYVDTRPNLDPNEPEKRHYAAYYMLNDEPVGEMGSTTRLLVSAEGA